MQTYYDEDGNKLGRAWSAAIDECGKTKRKDNHKPHPFHPEFAMYGPYMCAGFPKIKLFNQPPRKAVN